MNDPPLPQLINRMTMICFTKDSLPGMNDNVKTRGGSLIMLYTCFSKEESEKEGKEWGERRRAGRKGQQAVVKNFIATTFGV
jgi:hypothetical protein